MRVEGQLVLDNPRLMLEAALAEFGLAYVPEEFAAPDLAKGRSSGYSRIGAPRVLVTIFTTQGDASPRPGLLC